MPSTPAHPPPPYHRTYKRFGVLHAILVKTCCCCLVVYVMLAVVFVKSVCCCCCCSHPLHHPAVVVCYVFPLVLLTCQLFRSTIIVLQLGLWPGLVFVPLESLYTGKHILSQNTQYSILVSVGGRHPLYLAYGRQIVTFTVTPTS